MSEHRLRTSEGVNAAVSHGQEADVLRQGSEAADLSFLASTTALLFRAAAKRQSTEGMARLLERARTFALTLREIQHEGAKKEPDLPYRQLVPVRIWRTVRVRAAQFDSDYDRLLQTVPTLIEQLSEGTADRAYLIVVADDLDRLATLLREQTAQALNAVSS